MLPRHLDRVRASSVASAGEHGGAGSPDPTSSAAGVLGPLTPDSERWKRRGEPTPRPSATHLVSVPYEMSVSEFHAPPPVLRVPPAGPAAALLSEDPFGGLGEGGHALGAALLGEGVSTGSRQLAVGESQLAGLGELDERRGTDSEFAAASADDEPLDPASGSGRLNEQIQAMPSACRPGGAERTKAAESALTGWRPRRLVLGVVAAALPTTSIPPFICGNGVDFIPHPDPYQLADVSNKPILFSALRDYQHECGPWWTTLGYSGSAKIDLSSAPPR